LGADRTFSGSLNWIMDEDGSWQRGLTNAEISDLYNSGNWLPFN
jgi:hypothetical protein